MVNINFKKTTAIIAVHESIPVGPSHEIRTYLLERKIGKLIFITHPLTYLKEFYKESSTVSYYIDGKLKRKKIAFHWVLPEPLLYVKDVLYTLYWCLKAERKYDFYVGVDPLNAFSGILLKKLGRVDKVIYLSIDYFTQRFENNILNKIYHATDKFCVWFADETWNLSIYMALAREKYNHMDLKKYNEQYTVPVGAWVRKVKRKPFERINKKKIVFIGNFIPIMGIDLILAAMPIILKKIPDIKLSIIGEGPESAALHKLAKDLKLTKHITFYGWVSDKKKLAKLLSDGAVGLAPFNTLILDDQVRNADPGKLKDYMVWGMPVVVTDAISHSKQIENAKCGIIISYNKVELAAAVLKLMTNQNTLRRYRANAVKYMEQFDYETIFGSNLSRVLKLKE